MLFLGQALGCLLLVALVAFFRPALSGRLCGGYLSLSTLVLLALSRNVETVLAFALFLVWVVLSIGTARLLVARIAGPELDTWGLAGGVLYAALVPLSLFLSVLGLMSRGPVLAVAFALAIPGGLDLCRSWRSRGRSAVRWLDTLGPVGAVSLGACWVALALAFVWSCTPETESDPMRTHIPYMQQLVRDGSLSVAPLDFQRLMVYGTRTVFAAGLAAGSMSLARWLSWFCVVVLAVLVCEEVTRRSANHDLGVLAAAALVTTPMTLWLSRTLYHDHVIALLCTTAFIALFRSPSATFRSGAVVSAFVMGCAAQTKYSVLLFVLVWVVCVVARAIRQRGAVAGARSCLGPLVTLALAACPWYLYSYATIGNPIFPYLNDLFGSPHWPKGESTSFDHATYTFGPGVAKKLLFPWYATFQSSRIDQTPNGRLGFAFLALLPFAAVCRRRHAIGLGAAGLAGFFLICLRSAYARYWFPMVPLILIPLLLALGETVSRTGWRWKRGSAPWVAAAVLTTLLVTLPVFMSERFGFPWKVYTQEVTESDWMRTVFAGFSAVERANAQWQPGDRVIASDFEAVYTLDAEAYALPFWFLSHYEAVDPRSFTELLETKQIRYWVVDHSRSDAVHFARFVGGLKYWTTTRLVAASSTLAVYDVASPRAVSVREVVRGHTVSPNLMPARPMATTESAGWSVRDRGDGAQAARVDGARLHVPPGASVSHDFPLIAGAETCRVVIAGVGGDPSGVVVLSILWLDGQGQQVDRVGGDAAYTPAERRVDFFAEIPSSARSGTLIVQPWQAAAVHLGDTTVELSRLRDGSS